VSIDHSTRSIERDIVQNERIVLKELS